MSESEEQKIKELNLDDEISKLITPTYQIKFIENVGYVFIGEGYLIMADGTEPTHHFLHYVFDTPEATKKEIIKETSKHNGNVINDYDDIVDKVVNKLDSMPVGSEMTLVELIGKDNNKYTSDDLFKIHKLVVEKCRDNNIPINKDKYKNQVIGLPYHIPFVKG